MKTSVKICLLVVLLALAAGCGLAAPAASGGSGESDASQVESSDPQPLTYEALQKLKPYVSSWEYKMYSTWEGEAPAPPNPPYYSGYELIGGTREGDTVQVEIEHYGPVFLDPYTLEENVEYGEVEIRTKDTPYAPLLARARSLITLKQTPSGYQATACVYEVYPSPGLDYLREQTQRLAPQLEASQKLDITRYDSGIVNGVWRSLLSTRLIEQPEDITLYDLEHYDGLISIDYGVIDYDASLDPSYELDASLLSLMPNLTQVTAWCRLTDYSIFETMNNLELLTLHGMGDKDYATLKVGHTKELCLQDPTGIVNLSSANTEALRLKSWSTAISGFQGCETVKKFYMMSTRTDTALLNASNLPGVEYINLYFYSDNGRIRDLSGLSTFQNVPIDLYLDYQACRDETLQSLQGVKLRDVYLNAENGSYPLEFDRSLAESLDAVQVVYAADDYFQERTE